MNSQLGSSMVSDVLFVHFIYALLIIWYYYHYHFTQERYSVTPSLIMHALCIASCLVIMLAVKIVVMLDALTKSVGLHSCELVYEFL